MSVFININVNKFRNHFRNIFLISDEAVKMKHNIRNKLLISPTLFFPFFSHIVSYNNNNSPNIRPFNRWKLRHFYSISTKSSEIIFGSDWYSGRIYLTVSVLQSPACCKMLTVSFLGNRHDKETALSLLYIYIYIYIYILLSASLGLNK